MAVYTISYAQALFSVIMCYPRLPHAALQCTRTSDHVFAGPLLCCISFLLHDA